MREMMSLQLAKRQCEEVETSTTKEDSAWPKQATISSTR
jgi:hypothetical protein